MFVCFPIATSLRSSGPPGRALCNFYLHARFCIFVLSFNLSFLDFFVISPRIVSARLYRFFIVAVVMDLSFPIPDNDLQLITFQIVAQCYQKHALKPQENMSKGAVLAKSCTPKNTDKYTTAARSSCMLVSVFLGGGTIWPKLPLITCFPVVSVPVFGNTELQFSM